jgi:hypothetical protein
MMTLVFLAMMWRNADGSFTFGFWYVAVVAVLMFVSGTWSLVAPESFRVFYFNLLRSLRRVGMGRRATTDRLLDAGSRPIGWGWGSPDSIRFWGAVEIALAAGFMAWVLFFTVPGAVY